MLRYNLNYNTFDESKHTSPSDHKQCSLTQTKESIVLNVKNPLLSKQNKSSTLLEKKYSTATLIEVMKNRNIANKITSFLSSKSNINIIFIEDETKKLISDFIKLKKISKKYHNSPIIIRKKNRSLSLVNFSYYIFYIINEKEFNITELDKNKYHYQFENIKWGRLESPLLVSCNKISDDFNNIWDSEYKKLKMTSKEFYGPIKKPISYKAKWSALAYNKVFFPINDVIRDYCLCIPIYICQQFNIYGNEGMQSIQYDNCGFTKYDILGSIDLDSAPVDSCVRLKKKELCYFALTTTIPFVIPEIIPAIVSHTIAHLACCTGFFAGACKDTFCSNIKPYHGYELAPLTPSQARELKSEAPKQQKMK